MRRGLPFLCIRPGASYRHWPEKSVENIELPRSRLSVRIEEDLCQDLAILRHLGLVRERFRAFRPDVVHVTSMGDFGLRGLRLAREFDLPLVMAWHTNVHEYAAWRFEKAASLVPAGARAAMAGGIERLALAVSIWFYRKAAVGLAPNSELVDLLRSGTRKPAYLMKRGVDTVLFDPSRRERGAGRIAFGYVGRLSTEKNLRLLGRLEDALLAEGLDDFHFEIVGHGSEREWLQANLKRARLRGVLHGEDLAQAYANMDTFLFPSRTDTYGNVVWEAMASGIPAVVTDGGGPRFIVRDGETGLVSRSDDAFIRNAIALYRDPERRALMGRAGRLAALRQSWDAVFDKLYSEAYPTAVGAERGAPTTAARAD